MELLPEDIRQQLPPLYSQEHEPDPMVICKFFHPLSHWTWYAYEGSAEGDDFIFFGWVYGDFPELGYFSLSELESVNVIGLGIERDEHFTPMRLSVVKKLHAEVPPTQPPTLTIYIVGDETLDLLLTYDPETEVNLDITPDNPNPIAVYHLNGHFVLRRWNGAAWEDATNNGELEPEVQAYLTAQFEVVDNDSWFPILKTIAAKAHFAGETQQ